jgi:hypothetical protein
MRITILFGVFSLLLACDNTAGPGERCDPDTPCTGSYSCTMGICCGRGGPDNPEIACPGEGDSSVPDASTDAAADAAADAATDASDGSAGDAATDAATDAAADATADATTGDCRTTGCTDGSSCMECLGAGGSEWVCIGSGAAC